MKKSVDIALVVSRFLKRFRIEIKTWVSNRKSGDRLPINLEVRPRQQHRTDLASTICSAQERVRPRVS